MLRPYSWGVPTHDTTPSGTLQTTICFRMTFSLLQHLAEDGEDEEGESSAPDEGVEDHERPPDDVADGCAEDVGDNVARLAKESLQEHKQHKMNHAKRDVCKQERFNLQPPFITLTQSISPFPRAFHCIVWY